MYFDHDSSNSANVATDDLRKGLSISLAMQLDNSTLDDHGQGVNLQAAIMLLRGRAYDALENQQRAIRWYKAALQADPFCYDAFKVWQFQNHDPATSFGTAKLVAKTVVAMHAVPGGEPHADEQGGV